MNDKLNIPHCIKNYGTDSYPCEQGFVPENVFLERPLRSLRTLSQTLAQVLTHVSLHRKKWKSSSSAATTIQKLISNSPDYRTESVPNLFRGVFCFFVYFA